MSESSFGLFQQFYLIFGTYLCRVGKLFATLQWHLWTVVIKPQQPTTFVIKDPRNWLGEQEQLVHFCLSMDQHNTQPKLALMSHYEDAYSFVVQLFVGIMFSSQCIYSAVLYSIIDSMIVSTMIFLLVQL